jgi:hypothetical protein
LQKRGSDLKKTDALAQIETKILFIFAAKNKKIVE